VGVDISFVFRARIRLLAATAVMSIPISTPLAANASTHFVSIVRDGFYAGVDSGSSALAFFHVRHHRIYHLRFSLELTCHNSNTGQDYPRTFSAGSRMPQGRLIPANGTLSVNWVQQDGGRRGHINGELTFHRHWLASFSVTSGGGFEDCTGLSAVLLQRAHKTPPIPHDP
jgi:hypothetical protein